MLGNYFGGRNPDVNRFKEKFIPLDFYISSNIALGIPSPIVFSASIPLDTTYMRRSIYVVIPDLILNNIALGIPV